MNNWCVEYLACPKTNEQLELKSFTLDAAGNIVNGVLISKISNKIYLVIDGIPRFVPKSLFDSSDFEKTYMKELLSLGYFNAGNFDEEDSLLKIKKETSTTFGWEWMEYKQWGWQDKIPEIDDSMGKGAGHSGTSEQTVLAFKNKSLLDRLDLDAQVVMDAGCGNGRFSYQAYKYGAKVIGIDLGEGSVKASYENTKGIDDIQIIQGDLLNPPFKNESFDSGFSIGVLMHTGNAKLAHKSLVKKIKLGGAFTAHVYRRGNIIVEMSDIILRKLNRLLSHQQKIAFARFMAHTSQRLSKITFGGKDFSWFFNHFIQLRNTYHQNFDWWSAPIATHHTYEEVSEWFLSAGMTIEREGNRKYNGFQNFFPQIGVVTIKGRKKE